MSEKEKRSLKARKSEEICVAERAAQTTKRGRLSLFVKQKGMAMAATNESDLMPNEDDWDEDMEESGPVP